MWGGNRRQEQCRQEVWLVSGAPPYRPEPARVGVERSGERLWMAESKDVVGSGGPRVTGRLRSLLAPVVTVTLAPPCPTEAVATSLLSFSTPPAPQ